MTNSNSCLLCKYPCVYCQISQKLVAFFVGLEQEKATLGGENFMYVADFVIAECLLIHLMKFLYGFVQKTGYFP